MERITFPESIPQEEEIVSQRKLQWLESEKRGYGGGGLSAGFF